MRIAENREVETVTNVRNEFSAIPCRNLCEINYN